MQDGKLSAMDGGQVHGDLGKQEQRQDWQREGVTGDLLDEAASAPAIAPAASLDDMDLGSLASRGEA